MRLVDIINDNSFEENKLYLLEKGENDCSYFYQDGLIYFGRISTVSKNESINTRYLDMNLYVYISSESSGNTLPDGYYDLICYKGSLDDDYFELFVKICDSYAHDSQNMSFEGFFNSLIELFQEEKKGTFTDIIGLMGELYFIKNAYDKYDINITDNWHLVGKNSKFDFSFDNFNIEIKSTIKAEEIFSIKHNQVFNNQNNYIGVVSMIDSGTGMSLKDMSDFFGKGEFANDVKFQIVLSKEITVYKTSRDYTRKFEVEDIQLYCVKDMEKVSYIPSCVSNLVYEYDFSDTPRTNITDVLGKW